MEGWSPSIQYADFYLQLFLMSIFFYRLDIRSLYLCPLCMILTSPQDAGHPHGPRYCSSRRRMGTSSRGTSPTQVTSHPFHSRRFRQELPQCSIWSMRAAVDSSSSLLETRPEHFIFLSFLEFYIVRCTMRRRSWKSFWTESCRDSCTDQTS